MNLEETDNIVSLFKEFRIKRLLSLEQFRDQKLLILQNSEEENNADNRETNDDSGGVIEASGSTEALAEANLHNFSVEQFNGDEKRLKFSDSMAKLKMDMVSLMESDIRLSEQLLTLCCIIQDLKLLPSFSPFGSNFSINSTSLGDGEGSAGENQEDQSRSSLSGQENEATYFQSNSDQPILNQIEYLDGTNMEYESEYKIQVAKRRPCLFSRRNSIQHVSSHKRNLNKKLLKKFSLCQNSDKKSIIQNNNHFPYEYSNPFPLEFAYFRVNDENFNSAIGSNENNNNLSTIMEYSSQPSYHKSQNSFDSGIHLSSPSEE